MAIKNSLIKSSKIENLILRIRGHNVMLDKDLAVLYGVTTKHLSRQVTRNKDRFPIDFMFVLNKEEFENLRYQFGTSRWGGTRYLPKVFTEQGVAMLSSVLNSDKAIEVGIVVATVREDFYGLKPVAQFNWTTPEQHVGQIIDSLH